MSVESEVIKASAQMEAESILADKSDEFTEGFYYAMEFMLDYSTALLKAYGKAYGLGKKEDMDCGT